MGLFRTALPHAGDGLFLAHLGEGEGLPLFFDGRAALRERLLGLMELAGVLDAGFILDVPLAQQHGLPAFAAEAEAADRDAIAFAAALRGEAELPRPVLLNVTLGPYPDWNGEWRIVCDEGERLFVSRLGWLARSEIDLVSGPAFGSAARAIGLIEIVQAADLPVAVTFAIGPEGRLADGQPLREAIEAADAFTGAAAAWFTVECANPAWLVAALGNEGAGWARRIRGIRATPQFPDQSTPAQVRSAYTALAERAPWLNVVNIAGGRDLRHAAAMARALREAAAVPA